MWQLGHAVLPRASCRASGRQAGDHTLDKEVSADERSHQAADRTVLPERYEGAEIAIMEFLERLPGQTRLDLTEYMIGHLMSCLGRGGIAPEPSGSRQYAQSPIAKISGSRVV